MSVTLAGRATSIEQVLTGHSDFSLVAFTAARARERNLGIALDPLDGEPDHALVFGNKTDAVRKFLARECSWVVYPVASVCKRPEGCICSPST
jgi:hypothetical protein